MFTTNFDFQIISYKSLRKTDIFIYTDSGGYALILPEYLGFFRKIKLNNLLKNFKDDSYSPYMYTSFRNKEEKKDAFINNLIKILHRNGFKVTLIENKR